NLVHDVGGCVPEHALGADIEYLNDALLVGGDTRKVGTIEDGALEGPRLEQSLFRPLAGAVVGPDQQIADDFAVSIAQRRDRHDRGKATAILADVSQFVNVLDPAVGFEDQGLKARSNGGSDLDAQRFGARYHFLRIGNVGRRDLVHHVGGRVAEHALSADIEYLNDTLLVGGDTRKVGAVENRVLQSPRFN